MTTRTRRATAVAHFRRALVCFALLTSWNLSTNGVVVSADEQKRGRRQRQRQRRRRRNMPRNDKAKKNMEDFRRKHDIRGDVDVEVFRVDFDDVGVNVNAAPAYVTVGDRRVPLSGGRPADVFDRRPGVNPRYMADGVYQDHLPASRSTMIVDDDGDDDVIIMTTADGDGNLKSVRVFDRRTGSVVLTLEAYEEPGTLAVVRDEDLDLEDLNRRFRYGEMMGGENDGDDDRRLKALKDDPERRRHLQSSSCTEYRVIDLAVAYESSFCAEAGNADAANAEVMALVAAVSIKYQQPGLCTKVELSHLEGYCDPATDPYRPSVELNSSGCGSEGLLQGFQNYWRNNRADVVRDDAQLFSGTGLECDAGGGCVIGCAYLGVLCNDVMGYGVNYVTFSSNANLRAVLIAHEMGHNADGEHYSPTGHIMNPSVGAATFGFSAVTIDSFLNHFDRVDCVTLEQNDAPTSTPTRSPTKSPTKAPTQSPTKAPTQSPTKAPTQSPTKAPTRSPTTAPTTSPTSNPTSLPGSPTPAPTKSPTRTPTQSPTDIPTRNPTRSPTSGPTPSPTTDPTSPPGSPTPAPTSAPTEFPTTSFPTTSLPPVPDSVCGDGVCDFPNETADDCSSDCEGGLGDYYEDEAAVCGNGVCETYVGENCVTCPSD